MKKDIILPKVIDVYIAIVSEENDHEATEWTSYLINNKEIAIEQAFATTRGYGEIKGEEKKTATFRYALGDIPPKSFKKIESIPEELFALNNEFWLSFYIGREIYDKKYIFLPESISHFNSINTPVINKLGVMI